MKKINAILSNSTKEQYPVYVGLEVEQLTVKQSGESVYVFGINGKDVDTEKHLCLEVKHSPSPLRMLSP